MCAVCFFTVFGGKHQSPLGRQQYFSHRYVFKNNAFKECASKYFPHHLFKTVTMKMNRSYTGVTLITILKINIAFFECHMQFSHITASPYAKWQHRLNKLWLTGVRRITQHYPQTQCQGRAESRQNVNTCYINSTRGTSSKSQKTDDSFLMTSQPWW